MNLKQINELLANPHDPKGAKLNKAIESESWMHEVEDGGSMASQRIEIYDIDGEPDIKLKITKYCDSYGEHEYVDSLEFIKEEDVEMVRLSEGYE